MASAGQGVLAARIVCSFLLAALLFALQPAGGWARDLRRSVPFVRPLLMGDAYVAVGDEASALFYNPAALARLADSSVEAFSVQFIGDKKTTAVLLDEEDLKQEFGGLSASELANESGTTLFFGLTLRAPIVVDVEDNSAWGFALDGLSDLEVFIDQAGLPALSIETFIDQVAFVSWFGRLGDHVALGATFKLINRAGIDKEIDFATLFASGPELELENDPTFQELQEGKRRLRTGLDLGLIFEIPGSENWQPRFGLSALNIGDYDSQRGWLGIEFGNRPSENQPPVAGELPLIVSLGFAVSPTFGNIRYTFALDMVDLARTALEGDSLNNRTRVGFELGIGPHKDGTALFSLLFGWNATHFGVGVLSRVWIFEIGFGRYTVERGEQPGDQPQERRVVLIGLRF